MKDSATIAEAVDLLEGAEWFGYAKAIRELVVESETLRAEVRSLRDALERTRVYIQTAMRPMSIKEACGETAWDRAQRSGLQHALNAITAEFAKAEPAALAPSGAAEESDVVTLECGCQMTKGWRCPVHGQP